jgi:hypothetical protein
MISRAPVPGSQSNAVTLLQGLDAKNGIIKLRNIGRHALAVGAVDQNGKIIEPHLFLLPGEAISSFVPPSNAVKIILVGEKQEPAKEKIDGLAILEYDVPWFS